VTRVSDTFAAASFPRRTAGAVVPRGGGIVRSLLRAAATHVEARFGRGVLRAVRRVALEWRAQRTHRAAVAKAGQRVETAPVRLNLGSGRRPRTGWVNVDLHERGADLQLDLREPLPFRDASVAEIAAEDLLDHLSYPNLIESTAWELETPQTRSEALGLLRECHRVLVAGGRLEIVVPDAERILQAYVARRERGFRGEDWDGPSWCDTPMHALNYLFRRGVEHQYAYDYDTLQRMLERAGFIGVERCTPGAAVGDPRAARSLCVRAFKPERRSS